MKKVVVSVKTAEAEEKWDLMVDMPENFDEAVKVYGENAAFDMFESGLKVKIQNAGREVMRSGGTREESEEAANAYKPGVGRTSKKEEATNLIIDRAEDLREDATLHANVMSAFKSNKFDEVIELLTED